MYADIHHPPAFAAGDLPHRIAASAAAGAFLLAVGLAAALLSLWRGAVGRLTRRPEA